MRVFRLVLATLLVAVLTSLMGCSAAQAIVRVRYQEAMTSAVHVIKPAASSSAMDDPDDQTLASQSDGKSLKQHGQASITPRVVHALKAFRFRLGNPLARVPRNLLRSTWCWWWLGYPPLTPP
jgi:hypothetical protein